MNASVEAPDDLFLESAQKRIPCVILLDTSSSMEGDPISALSKSLPRAKSAIENDNMAKLAVELAVITFGNGGVKCVQDWTDVSNFHPPVLSAGGTTPLGDALNLAMDMIDTRKAYYRQKGASYYQPWLWILTDGAPDKDAAWKTGSKRVKTAVENRKLAAWALTTDVHQESLDSMGEAVSTNHILLLEQMNFEAAFEWLSKSLVRVSKTGNQADTDPLPPQIKFSDPFGADPAS